MKEEENCEALPWGRLPVAAVAADDARTSGDKEADGVGEPDDVLGDLAAAAAAATAAAWAAVPAPADWEGVYARASVGVGVPSEEPDEGES